MRLDTVLFRSARLGAWCVVVLVVAALVSCAKVPIVGGKPQISLKLTSTTVANSCGKGTGNSLYFRVLQVTDATAVGSLTLAQLWDKEDKVLGPALVARSEDVIDAASSREIKIERDPKAKAIVVVGNFCKTEGTCWRVIRPVSAGTSFKLQVDASCLSEAKR
jgi:type VI secretion system VasD/TssJ family lipoprotein